MATAFNRVLLQQAGDAPGSRIASARPQAQAGADGTWLDERNTTWAQVYGDNTRMGLDASRSTGDLSANSLGLALGHDRKVTADTTVGLALGSSIGRTNVSDQFSARSNALQLGGYGITRSGAAYASAAASYSLYRMKTDRSLAATQSSYGASFDAHSLSTRVETGYRLGSASFAATPYAALQLQRVVTPGYSETAQSADASGLALDYERRSVNYVRTELGMSVDKTFAFNGNTSLALRTTAAWVHNRSSNPDLRSSFSGLAAGDFTHSAVISAVNHARVSAGADFTLAKQWSLGMNVYGEFGKATRTVAGGASLRHQF